MAYLSSVLCMHYISSNEYGPTNSFCNATRARGSCVQSSLVVCLDLFSSLLPVFHPLFSYLIMVQCPVPGLPSKGDP